jgi:MoaA/NifB/PqqE/SkfB family radical SAM enzyme
VAEVTLMHFGRVERPIASFGQGCEGEPLSRGAALVEAVRLVREKDSTGTVNLNTNASRPDLIDELLAAGLSSIRVSMASPTESLYNLYHRPQSYAFSHVVESLRIARRRGAFVSINLLAFPGLTDRTSEVERLEALIGEHGVGMIQWRNLNIDPEHHLDVLGRGEGGIGMKAMVERVRARFPSLRHGYFNPFVPGGQPPRAGAQP